MQLNIILSKIIWQLPPTLRDSLRNIKRCGFGMKKRPSAQFFIQVIDGSSFHGGLTDRFKGIISSYLFCKIIGLDFKILHIHPFDLSKFLKINKYNWQFENKNEISYNIFETKLLYQIGDCTINRFKTLKTNKQIHCFSNRDVTISLNNYFGTCYSWGELFKELFKPTEYLLKELQKYKYKIGGKYYSAVFRFQNLLGDFTEYDDVSELSNVNKIQLIEKCKKSLAELKLKLNSQKILVTSDSKFFLEQISSNSDFYTFPEDVVHIDNSTGNTIKIYQKSFIDFYLLSESLAIYSIGTEKMYKTEFPMYAAKLNNVPFKRIEID